METLVCHIYHSPIGQLSITAEEGCITELIFIEDATVPVPYEEEEENLPQVIHQCVEEIGRAHV